MVVAAGGVVARRAREGKTERARPEKAQVLAETLVYARPRGDRPEKGSQKPRQKALSPIDKPAF